MNREWPYSTNPFKKDPPEGAVAIVMPVRGQEKFARLAYYSIRSFTDLPYMFAFVNNMSDLKTKLVLTGISKNHHVWMLDQHVEFDKGALANFGFDFLFENPAIRFGAIVDSDVIVEPEWLSRLVNFLKLDDFNGIVSPFMNNLPARTHGRVSGTCMVFRREVYERVGKFPVGNGLEGGEDVQFCMAAEAEGFRVSVLDSVAIHHFGGITRRGLENTVKSTNLQSTSKEGSDERIPVESR